jgi:endogenous inhibitor of DNA gyrase (YacG/DUF329 family)
MECPICQAPVRPRAENPVFPFCSQRCQLVDLSRWLDGDYRIPGEPVDDVPLAPDADLHGDDDDDLRH